MVQQELETAIAAAREAGDEVARMRAEGVRFGRKYGRELVSEADLRAAEILHSRLTTAFPDAGWLSEEHVDTGERLRHDRVWIVDPIDGTREYLMGRPEYAISVALVGDQEPTLGVVYNPATEELLAAAVDGSSEMEPEDPPDEFEVLVGHGEANHNHGLPLPGGGRRKGIGSIAYRLGLVSAGRGHAVVTNYGRSEWDVAAGAALCFAAGLRVTDVLGQELQFNQPDPWVRGLLVAGPGLHQRLHTHFTLLS
ncbi:MAG: 3'(2'),5'-bisphosphate nucleotidase CysQ [Dehalococcoidia bacterium]